MVTAMKSSEIIIDHRKNAIFGLVFHYHSADWNQGLLSIIIISSLVGLGNWRLVPTFWLMQNWKKATCLDGCKLWKLTYCTMYSMSIFTHQSTFFSQFLTFDLSFVEIDELLYNFLFALFHAFLDLILYQILRAVNGWGEFWGTEMCIL